MCLSFAFNHHRVWCAQIESINSCPISVCRQSFCVRFAPSIFTYIYANFGPIRTRNWPNILHFTPVSRFMPILVKCNNGIAFMSFLIDVMHHMIVYSQCLAIYMIMCLLDTYIVHIIFRFKMMMRAISHCLTGYVHCTKTNANRRYVKHVATI